MPYNEVEIVTGGNMAKLTYEKEITGLVLIDPYNDFISEGGKMSLIEKSGFALPQARLRAFQRLLHRITRYTRSPTHTIENNNAVRRATVRARTGALGRFR
jgi:hypothetical protein